MMDKKQVKKYNKELIKSLDTNNKKKKKVKTSELFVKEKPKKKNKKMCSCGDKKSKY
jgi:hypothetical protein